MEEAFRAFAGVVGLGVESLAVLVVAVGSIEAAVSALRVMVSRGTPVQMREVYLRYARWLVAGLTFQLAGDIAHTAIAPTWDELGRLGAIAAIRTFLAYFLDQDVERIRRLQQAERDRTEAQTA